MQKHHDTSPNRRKIIIFFQKSSSVFRRTYFERALHTNSCVVEAAPRGIRVASGLVVAAELNATDRGAKMKGAVLSSERLVCMYAPPFAWA
jgi:hypothetical protein